jgi:hypothetical protein
MRLGGPQSSSGRGSENKNPGSYRESNSGRLASCLVTTLTEPPQILQEWELDEKREYMEVGKPRKGHTDPTEWETQQFEIQEHRGCKGLYCDGRKALQRRLGVLAVAEYTAKTKNIRRRENADKKKRAL